MERNPNSHDGKTRCFGCGEEFSSGAFPTHARLCTKYQIKKLQMIKKLTYEFLYHEYIEEEKSASQISREMGFCKATEVKAKLKEYGIKERTLKESRKTKGYIEQCKKTSLEKYGTEYHTMKNSTIRQKIFDGVKEKYGVDNVFQADAVKEKIKETCLERYGVEHASQAEEIKERAKNTCIKKYGVDNAAKNIDIINKTKEKWMNNPKSFSHSSPFADEFFSQLISKLGSTDHIHCHTLGKEYSVMSKEKLLYFYDFVDTLKGKVIEFNGDYWHANPEVYSKDWINTHNGLVASEIWARDSEKIKTIKEERGYSVLVIWEKDVRRDRDGMIEKCIEFLNS